MRYVIRLAVLLSCALASLATASAEKRVALVIGNADYKIGRLANPVNDAEAVAEAFKSQLKFDTVILRKDLKREGFVEALREMAGAAVGAEIGVVFFAGHGIEVGGRNYLIPVDAALGAARDIELETVALDTILSQLDGVTKLRLVILDACRNNPFAVSGAKRSVMRGLGRIEPEGNTLVAYAAKDGTTADDGKGQHSPFTSALLKRIVTPGLDVRRLFGYVSDDVKADTNHLQEPYLYGQVGGEEIYLVKQVPPIVSVPPPPSVVVAPSQPPPPVKAQSDAMADAARFCREVAGISSLSVLGAMADQHKGTVAGSCITARIDELTKAEAKKAEGEKTTAVLAPPKVAGPPRNTKSPQVSGAGASAWVKVCDRGQLNDREGRAIAKDVDRCVTLTEQIHPDSGRVMLGVRFQQWKLDGGEKRILSVTVPEGVATEFGAAVTFFPTDLWLKVQRSEKLDTYDETRVKASTVKLAFTHCEKTECIAETEATPLLIDMLKNNAGLLVYTMRSPRTPVAQKASLTGFAQALEGPPTDMQKFKDARQALMKQIAERQKKK